MKLNAEKDALLDYLRRQLDQGMRSNRKEIQSSCSSSESKPRRRRPKKKLVILV